MSAKRDAVRKRRIAGCFVLNQEAEAVLRAAGLVAQVFGAALSFIHVAQGSDSILESEDAVNLKFRGVLGSLGISAPVRILEGSLAAGLRRIALDEFVDLVIVGRGHNRGTVSRLWSHLYEIVREAPCPVLSV